MTRRALQFGLVGLGRWGRNICQTVSRLKGIELSAVCSGNPDASSMVPPGCEIHRNWESLLALKRLDGLLLAVPPSVQVEIALASIERHLPVFLEKPLATDMETAACIYRTATQAKCPVLVDHIYTFHPGFRKLVQLARTNGSVNWLRSRGGNHGPYRTDIDPLWDWAPHDVSMCLAIMNGLPISIEASISRQSRHPGGMAANYSVSMVFQDGAVAELEFGNAMSERIREMSVGTSTSNFVFKDTEPWITHTCRDNEKHHYPYRRQRALSVAIRSFSRNIWSGNSANRQLRQSVDVTATIARIESALGD